MPACLWGAWVIRALDLADSSDPLADHPAGRPSLLISGGALAQWLPRTLPLLSSLELETYIPSYGKFQASFGLLIPWLVLTAQSLPMFVPGSPHYTSLIVPPIRPHSLGLRPVLSCLHFPLALAASPYPAVRSVFFLAECPAPRENLRRFQRKKTVPHVVCGV